MNETSLTTSDQRRNLTRVTKISLSMASPDDREEIYRLRHEVYARELRQHEPNAAGKLRDALDDWNIYLVARTEGEIAGFISITPPGGPSYSIDKYFKRG